MKKFNKGTPWYEGSSDPIDSFGRMEYQEYLTQKGDARRLDQPLQGQPTLAVEADFGSQDPADILEACQDRDEAEGCERGAHLAEYMSRFSITKERPQMSLLQKIKFDPAQPIVARGGGKGLVSTLNFSILNLIRQHLREQMYGAPTDGVEGANEEAAAKDATAEEKRTREEQGFDTPVPPLVTAAKLKLIRDAVNGDLIENAARKPMVTDPNKTLPDAYHVGQDFRSSVDWAVSQVRGTNEAQMVAEAKAMNVDVEEIRASDARQTERQRAFLKDNLDDIVTQYYGLTAIGQDGHPLSLDDAEAVLSNLPAIQQMRVAAAIDRGLYKQRGLELDRRQGRYREEAKTNIALLDGARREVLAEVARWMEKQPFKDQLDAFVGNAPEFAPVPHVQLPDEADEARGKNAVKKKKAA